MDFIVHRGVYLGGGGLGAERAQWYAGATRHLAALLEGGWLTIWKTARSVDLLTRAKQEALISWMENVGTMMNTKGYTLMTWVGNCENTSQATLIRVREWEARLGEGNTGTRRWVRGCLYTGIRMPSKR